MNRHLGLNAFYVWSKTLDSVELQNNTSQGGAQDMSKLREEKGRADTDQRHTFAASVVFQPDYYNGGAAVVRNVVNGWAISSIIKLRSGTPFTVLNGLDANLDGAATDRAELVGDPHIANPSAAEWFNTAAFAQNPVVTGVATDGNSPRNFLDNPGYRDVDLAISRIFKLTERFGLEFRAEGSNAFNMVSLNAPGATVKTSTFGVITTAQPMRKLQFGLRLTF